VAKRVGISRPFYTQLEGGSRRLSVNYLIAIAEALEVKPTKLFPKWAATDRKAKTLEGNFFEGLSNGDGRGRGNRTRIRARYRVFGVNLVVRNVSSTPGPKWMETFATPRFSHRKRHLRPPGGRVAQVLY